MKKIFVIILCVCFMISLVSCGNREGAAQNSTHVIIDQAGNSVEVPNSIERIVVCDILPLPSVLSVFFGSAQKIVGMSETSYTAAKNGILSQLYPDILNAKTNFISGSDVNIEELIILDPDVVFYLAANTALGDKLRNAGFTAVAVDTNSEAFNNIDTLNSWIVLLDDIFQGDSKAQLVKDYSLSMLNTVRERVNTIPESDRPSAMFVVAYNDTTIMTSGKNFFGQWWADAAGFTNVGENIEQKNSVPVNMEQILAWDPDIVFLTNFNAATPDDIYNSTVGNYDWSAVNAVLEHRVYKMPLGMYRTYTPSADTPITLLWIAKTVYPDLFTDINLADEAVRYFSEVFGITITHEQAMNIFGE